MGARDAPVVTLPDGSTGPLTVTWTLAGITSEATVEAAIGDAFGRVMLLLDERELHDAQGRPHGRTNFSVTWGRLTATGIHLRADAGHNALHAALEPALTFERTMQLLAGTDPRNHTVDESMVHPHRLMCALVNLPAGPVRALATAMLCAGFTGTADDLLRATSTATDTETTNGTKPAAG